MSARAWMSFAAVSVLWGIPYLFIKVAVDDGMPPGFLAWARVVLAAVVLCAVAWRRGLLGSVRGRMRWVVVYAVVEISIPFPLIAGGERHVSSSLAAILIAAVPLIIAVLAVRFDPSERVTGRRLVGLLIGFAGVIALVGIDVAGRSDELIGALMILLAAVGYSIGPMTLSAKMGDIEPVAMMGSSLAVASVVLTPLALLDVPEAAPSAGALSAVVVLGLLCTAAAFVLFGGLLLEVGAGRASVITYVAPVVAVGLGVAVLGERPGVGAVAGLLLILAGSWLSTDGRLPPGIAEALERRRGRRGGVPPTEPPRSSASTAAG
jgi:drug/metabolite transporter (DMT)-like permease